MTVSRLYFTRAGRAATNDVSDRSPELRPLRRKAVALFGAGCLGAPSALELARAGILELRILDADFVDPATIGRWSIGLSAAGLPKVDVLAEFIRKNYPPTQVVAVPHRLGAVRNAKAQAPTDHDAINRMIAGASLIYDATAEVGVQHYLSQVAREAGISYICVVGTYGGWGGKIVRIVPEKTKGCWMCYRCALDDGTITEPPSDPSGEIQPRGCGDVTFTAAGFDMTQIALTAVRLAVSVLCDGTDGAYPPTNCDVMTIAFRDDAGKLIVPNFQGYVLSQHPKCPYCSPQ